MHPGTAAFIRLAKHPVKFRFFLLAKLPSAYFAGIRIKEADERKCVTTIRYKWFSRNPFRSIYFACLAMAAEMSTGTLAMAHLYKRIPSVSMLPVKFEAEYFKKATGRVFFTCEDGELTLKKIEEAISSGVSTSIRARSIGLNEKGEKVAEFFITWSFKVRVKEKDI